MPIAEALVAKGFEVVIGYGELGGADLELLKKKVLEQNLCQCSEVG